MDQANAEEKTAAESAPKGRRKRKPTSNQFIKAKEQGQQAAKAQNQYTTGKRRARDPKEIDFQRAELAAKKLEAHLEGRIELTDSQIAAAKALVPFGKATLSSVAQTVKEEPANEGEIMAGLAHLLSANAGVLRQLLEADPNLRASLQAVLAGGPVAVNAPQQSATKAA